ncbi:hypothetical protein ACPFUO_003488 [Vibrio cholerae]|nr:hypothetical protein [Vibrio cholerae]
MLNSNENIAIMKRFMHMAENHVCGDDSKQFLLNSSITIVSRIVISPDTWNELCGFNCENVGTQLFQRLKNLDTLDDNHDHIFVILYRFACEFDFSGGVDYEIATLLRNIDESNINLSGELSGQINYARYAMPVAITKRVLNDPSIKCFKEFPELAQKANSQRDELENSLSEKIEEVNKLKDALNMYKDAFNFVGLHQGFGNILKMKQSERSKLLKFIVLLGFILPTPILLTIFLKAKVQLFGVWDGVSFLLPVMSLEIILIYYFRILLGNYNSIKAQIVQLELRQTLCQFIQGYSEYAVSIRKNDKQVLDKFENIIFSNILTDESKIPSTFDGLDSIGNIMKSIKNT